MAPRNCTRRRRKRNSSVGPRPSARGAAPAPTRCSLKAVTRVTCGALFLQSKTDFQRHLPVADFTLINVSAGFGHLEPSHVANSLFRACQRILNGFLKSFCRRTDYFNFFVNVIGHSALSRGGRRKTMPKPNWIGTPRCRVPLARRADPANEQICFTSAPPFLHPPSVRKSIAVCLCFVTTLSCAFAQDQEKKLVDRLLKPDMSLQNEAQNKKFIADGASTNKRANVGTFYVQK